MYLDIECVSSEKERMEKDGEVSSGGVGCAKDVNAPQDMPFEPIVNAIAKLMPQCVCNRS